MGNKQSNEQSETMTFYHEKFKRIQFNDAQNEMTLSIPYEQKSDIAQWEKLLKTAKDCDPEFLLMAKKYLLAEEGMCGSAGVIKIVYDNFPYSFDEEIQNHAEKYKHFEEPEVWYLLFAIISAVVEMDRVSRKVGDIRPYNIFVNQNGQVKLAGVYSWPKEYENFTKTSYDKTATYLAPEEVLMCRSGAYKKKRNSHLLGESFSIGLTLLHACLLKSMDSLYNIKKYEFNSHKLEEHLKQLRTLTFWNESKEANEKYSEELIRIIEKLLDIDDSTRLSSLELYSKLEPYAEQILNLREFEAPLYEDHRPQQNQSNSNLALSANKNVSHSNQRFSHTRVKNQIEKPSPQYSSIQKKDFVEGESMGLEMSYGTGMGLNNNNNYAHTLGGPLISTQNGTRSYGVSFNNVPVSASKEKTQKIYQKIQLPAESTIIRREQVNPLISEGQFHIRSSSQDQRYASNNLSSSKSHINSSIPIHFNHQTHAPSQVLGHRQTMPSLSNNSNQTVSFSGNTVARQNYFTAAQNRDNVHYRANSLSNSVNQSVGFAAQPTNAEKRLIHKEQPSHHSFFEPKNVNLATSGFIYRNSVDKNPASSITIPQEVRNGQSHTFIVGNPPSGGLVTDLRQGLQGQKTSAQNGDASESEDFLKKIDEQLHKSRQQFPSSK